MSIQDVERIGTIMEEYLKGDNASQQAVAVLLSSVAEKLVGVTIADALKQLDDLIVAVQVTKDRLLADEVTLVNPKPQKAVWIDFHNLGPDPEVIGEILPEHVFKRSRFALGFLVRPVEGRYGYWLVEVGAGNKVYRLSELLDKRPEPSTSI